MQKILFGIFAHPDDEAFGPVATLIKEARSGSEIHLITLTAGEGGTNPDNLPNLGDVRLDEWRAAGKLIGATSMHHLGYIDGTLGNKDHIEITGRISTLIRDIAGGRNDIEIEFMSLDLNGYSGHIDHIVAGRSACLAYHRLLAEGLPVNQVRLACLSRDEMPEVNTNFVYGEPGRTPDEISESIDGREFIDEIHAVMQCHHTQRGDYQAVTAYKGESLGIDNFIIKK